MEQHGQLVRTVNVADRLLRAVPQIRKSEVRAHHKHGSPGAGIMPEHGIYPVAGSVFRRFPACLLYTSFFAEADNSDGLLDAVVFRHSITSIIGEFLMASVQGGFHSRRSGSFEYIRMTGGTVTSEMCIRDRSRSVMLSGLFYFLLPCSNPAWIKPN